VVAKAIWRGVGEYLGMNIDLDYLSVASKWLHKDKNYRVNIISITVLRGVWLTKNDLVFHKKDWTDVKLIWRRILKLLLEWRPIYKELKMGMMMSWLSFLEGVIRRLVRHHDCHCVKERWTWVELRWRGALAREEAKWRYG
jgi:hypothetical protein